MVVTHSNKSKDQFLVYRKLFIENIVCLFFVDYYQYDSMNNRNNIKFQFAIVHAILHSVNASLVCKHITNYGLKKSQLCTFSAFYFFIL